MPASSDDATTITTRERLTGLRDRMVDVLTVAQRIATAVREEGSIAMPTLAKEVQPDLGPFDLKGLSHSFIDRQPAGLMHVMFAYAQPGSDTVDPNAQFHLHQLAGQALAFNLFCQRAERDQALGVALQSPDVPSAIDAILVRSAFFAAYFENMLVLESGAAATAATQALHRETLDRYLLMARDAMLAPYRAEVLIPNKEWPFVGIEMPVAPHDGDYFLNGIYFSAEYAGRLLEAASEEQSARLPAVA